ncbi:DUF1707 SHOCT-like domain-containing protein [Nocardia takedensis]
MAGESTRLRARDTDRADVCGVLDAALADGQLSASEHAARTESAMRAESFGDLDRLITDLQIPGDLVDAPVVRGKPLRMPRWAPAVGAVLAAALLGLVAGGIDRATADGPPEPPLPTLTTGPGLVHFLDDYRAAFGDLVFDDLTVYPEYALFHRADLDRTHSRYFRYDGEFSDYHNDAARKPDKPTVDLAGADLSLFARVLAGALTSLELPDGRITFVEFEYPASPAEEPRPYMYVTAGNAAQQSGNLTIALDGTVLEVRPPNS